MRLNQYLAVLLLILLTSLFVFKGIQKAIDETFESTAKTIRKVSR